MRRDSAEVLDIVVDASVAAITRITARMAMAGIMISVVVKFERFIRGELPTEMVRYSAWPWQRRICEVSMTAEMVSDASPRGSAV